ncbi:sigma-70 family RNA polymerase sigma factor [bacterium]|nr:sigma-70 family RNA polymerase sigma factor [bacterium]
MSAKRKYDKHTHLMLRFQNGDESAFRSLLISYKNRVYALCYRFFQNQAAAEEACQDSFHKIYVSRDSFQPEGAFVIWLFAIVNQVLQSSRHLGGNLKLEPVTRKNLKAYHTQSIESQTTIRRAMAALSNEERLTLLLDHWEKLSIPEISEILNRNPLAVESILFKARAKLRIKLAAYTEPVGVR